MRYDQARTTWLFPLFWIGYLALIHFTMGLRPEHFAVAGGLLLLFFAHSKTRQWTLAFFPFAIFAILYDFLRIYPKAWAGAIHIVEPYQLEATLFRWLGFNDGFIPTAFFVEHNHAILDVLAGIVYGLHVPMALLLALILWLRKSRNFEVYRWGFLAMNLAAFALYIGYPAAPPWYVTNFGFETLGWEAPSSAAGLIRFDNLLGVTYFQDTYAKSAWVFGALPSMHAAFPLFASLFARQELGAGRWIYYVFTLLVAFSAVYLNHHYFIDILAGWVYALAFYGVFSWCYGINRQPIAVDVTTRQEGLNDLSTSVSAG